MSSKSVVIRFLPVDADDEFGLRIVTLTPDSDTMEVGRASKREAKNLLPRANNALFDSRVMSRSHAKLKAAFEPKEVNLRDGASTHGTWLNGEKLSIEKDYTIVNGDLVAFGTEVIRGRDSFRPLKFRLEYNWMEPSPSCVESVPTTAQKPVQPTNTFCVPDNDDESDAAEDDADHTHETGSSFESDDYSENPSGGFSDSEDMSVVEVPSPFTQPPNFDQHELTGTQHSPIDLDSEEELQPLATPRMTPPSPAPNRTIISGFPEEPKDIDNEVDQLDQPVVSSMTQAPPISQLVEVVTRQYEVESDGDSYEPSESSCYEESVSDSEDSEEDEANMGANSQSEAVIISESEPQPEREPEQLDLNTSPPHPSMAINGQESGCPKFTNPYVNQTMLPCVQPVYEHSLGPLGSSDAAHDSRVPASSVHLPSPAQLLGHPVDAFRPTSLSWMTSGSSHPLPGLKSYIRPGMSIPPSWRPRGPSTYTDGPFVNDDYPSFVAPRDVSSHPALVNADEGTPKQSHEPVETVHPTHHEVESTLSDSKPSLKRKAEEMDATAPMSMNCTYSNKPTETHSDEEESLPDAQPLDLLEVVGGSQLESQASGSMQSVNDSLVVESVQETVPAVERPAKRTRTSGPSNLRTHATTAVIGAMVGAVGTVALLASLPQDYFL